MKKLGIDLGTNSIGWAIRDDSLSGNQFEHYGVTIFEKGVGAGKTGEFSFAAERTKNRSVRRLYQSRKYRLWKTLEVLIKYDYCPLSMRNLDAWRKYDKGNVLKGSKGRVFPIDDEQFNYWIRLDFNKDGLPDYKSPYQIRKELINTKLDISNPIERYKIGRALYHISQRRGFKSSRKTGDKENTVVYAGSKESGTRGVDDIVEFIKVNKTLGAALAELEEKGERIRNQYTLRRHFEEEVSFIFEHQGLDQSFYADLVKAIFYQRPLRSQKGLVGKCTLEPSKHRCPVSHPSFEEFRAWAFINNIKYRNDQVEWQYLSNERRNKLYFEKFLRKSKTVFPFSEIIDVLAKDGLKNAEYNFKPKTSVSGCPISARIKGIFGLEFNDPEFRIPRTDIRKLSKSQKLFYTNNDIWHILFSFEDEDHLVRFAEEKLKLKGDQIKEFTTLWKNLPNGYAALSINAINRILPFLREGLIYSEAVLLANMPRVFEDSLWTENKEYIKSCIQSLIDDNRREKQFLGIVNNLIANHKTIPYGERTGHKDDKYLLSQEDRRIILEVIEDAYGLKTWGNINDNEKARIIGCITELYQNYFRSGFEVKCFQDKKYLIVKIENRQYLMDADSRFYKLPTLLETIKQFLTERFQIPEENLNCLYHPSQIEIYTPSHPDVNDYKLYLQSPKTGAFKNPMAMRTLHELRKIINY